MSYAPRVGVFGLAFVACSNSKAKAHPDTKACSLGHLSMLDSSKKPNSDPRKFKKCSDL